MPDDGFELFAGLGWVPVLPGAALVPFGMPTPCVADGIGERIMPGDAIAPGDDIIPGDDIMPGDDIERGDDIMPGEDIIPGDDIGCGIIVAPLPIAPPLPIEPFIIPILPPAATAVALQTYLPLPLPYIDEPLA